MPWPGTSRTYPPAGIAIGKLPCPVARAGVVAVSVIVATPMVVVPLGRAEVEVPGVGVLAGGVVATGAGGVAPVIGTTLVAASEEALTRFTGPIALLKIRTISGALPPLAYPLMPL